jgi:hypothetical protein
LRWQSNLIRTARINLRKAVGKSNVSDAVAAGFKVNVSAGLRVASLVDKQPGGIRWPEIIAFAIALSKICGDR